MQLDKHRKAKTRTWDDGSARKWSEDHESESQYNPYEFGTDEAVREIELRCVEEGVPIRIGEKKCTFYLNVHRTVGVCSGIETNFVFAEWLKSGGAIHGRPISERALNKKGVNL